MDALRHQGITSRQVGEKWIVEQVSDEGSDSVSVSANGAADEGRDADGEPLPLPGGTAHGTHGGGCHARFVHWAQYRLRADPVRQDQERAGRQEDPHTERGH